MTFMDEPMAKNMSFQREYAEPYDWVAQQFKDWAFTLSTSILYYNDYDSLDEDARGLYRKSMAAFGGIAPSYHIELLDKPTIYWDLHSLLGIQMMFSFMLVDNDQPLCLCKHCQKVFLGSRSNATFCSPRCSGYPSCSCTMVPPYPNRKDQARKSIQNKGEFPCLVHCL